MTSKYSYFHVRQFLSIPLTEISSVLLYYCPNQMDLSKCLRDLHECIRSMTFVQATPKALFASVPHLTDR